MAGIIKAALSLHHEQIPPSLNFRKPNPQIDFAASPFFVNTELRTWPRSTQPRRAAVSAFGLGGTNAHVILEEAPLPARAPAAGDASPQVITLSAKSSSALDRMGVDLAAHLEENPDSDLADVAYTRQIGRATLPHRRSFVATSSDEAVRLLRTPDPHAVANRDTPGDGARVAFLFPGQGAQYPGMGAAPLRQRAGVRRGDGRVREDPRAHPRHVTSWTSSLRGRAIREAAEELGQATLAQPATFAIQYALARLWMSWGVQPSVMVGHSLGEFVAACLGGVFSLADALRLVAERGRLMQEQGSGAMIAIMGEPDAVRPLLDEQTSLAAINAPEQCVASGPEASIARLESRLARQRRRGAAAADLARGALAGDGPARGRLPRAGEQRHAAARCGSRWSAR